MGDSVGGVVASAVLNSNNCRIGHPLVRIHPVVGKVVQLDARCDRAQALGAAVMESQAFAWPSHELSWNLAEENSWRSSYEITECS